MKSIISSEVNDLFEIHMLDVELISIIHPKIKEVETLSQEIIDSTDELELRWIQELNNLNLIEDSLPVSISSDQRTMLFDQITESCKILAEVLGCSRFAVRLAKLRSPMCPLFHVDQIHCRLLIALCGNGTEWIESEMVDREILLDRKNINVPLKNGGEIKPMGTGHWCLLKGGKWQTNFSGVVHRSPHEINDRLLLSLDPIFDQ